VINTVRSDAIEGLTVAEKLPSFYGEDRLVLLTRDPYWLFAYWEVTPASRKQLEMEGRRAWEHLNLALRITRYDMDMQKEEGCFHIPINHTVDNWCIEVGVPDRYYKVELGGQIPDRGFFPLLCSNIVKTPRDQISSVIDENWSLPDWQTRRLYRRIDRAASVRWKWL
jgi:uncharacterized protein